MPTPHGHSDAVARQSGPPHSASGSVCDPNRLALVLNATCHNHPKLPPSYTCTECGTSFCKNCAKAVGSSTASVCQVCGALCLPFADVKKQLLLLADQMEAFGMSDFWLALRYPLRESVTVVGSALLYGAGLFSLPFFNLGNVGVLLGAIGLLPAMIANTIMFGIASSVINWVETGRTDGGEAFDTSKLLAELWDIFPSGCGVVAAVIWPSVLILGAGSRSSLLIWLSVAWIIFYYPLALLVAATTKRFWATLNPLSGLSAVYRLGSVYCRLLAMYLVVSAIAGVAVAIVLLTVLRAGFNLPVYLALGVVVAPPIFYANMVIAFLIGRALFKRADRFDA